MYRDTAQMKEPGAVVYYPDSVNGIFNYVKGKVIDSKSVENARRDWGQKWSHEIGTILKIEPVGKVDHLRPKFRHLSAVLSETQYENRKHRYAKNRESKV